MTLRKTSKYFCNLANKRWKKGITVDVNDTCDVIRQREEILCNPLEVNNLLENNHARAENQSYMLPKRTV